MRDPNDDDYDPYNPGDDGGGGGGNEPHPHGEFDDGWYGPWGFIPRTGGNPAGYQDLSYWASRGVFPDEMFRGDGSMFDNWKRTDRGYELVDLMDIPNAGVPPPSGDPYTYTGGGGGGGRSGGGGGFSFDPAPTLVYPDYESAGEFVAPEWLDPGKFVAPDRKAVGEFKPRTATFDIDPLSFDPYKASSWQDAESEPGFAAARDQLKKQTEASAAHRGVLRSGMTLSDLYTNLDALSQQNFKQFDDRRFRNYQGDVNNKISAWGANQDARLAKFQTEYGIDRDAYDRMAADIESGNTYAYGAARDIYDRHASNIGNQNTYRYGAAKDAFGFKATDIDRKNNYRFNVADAQFKDALERWKTQVNSLTSLAQPRD